MLLETLQPSASADAPAAVCSFTVPVKAESMNRSGRQTHWGQRKRRAAKHREAVGWCVMGLARPALPCVVTLTRIAPSNGLDPHDNLPGSLKHVADGVAEWLGANDRDPRLTWRYAQARGAARYYAVRVDIEAA